jgi:hypothetical protein
MYTSTVESNRKCDPRGISSRAELCVSTVLSLLYISLCIKDLYFLIIGKDVERKVRL